MYPVKEKEKVDFHRFTILKKNSSSFFFFPQS